ncbi:MAG: asparaginase [Magnetococcales bacterium]|nr:asparaginase [Magnetococcales bacterium]
MSIEPVSLSALEQDDRVDELVRNFMQALMLESGFAKLKKDQQEQVRSVLNSVIKMRFDSVSSFQNVVIGLLRSIAPDLEKYITIAIDSARDMLKDNKGVLVIYTGGTIGSAPKDLDDPDSPQIVKPWGDLKSAGPILGRLGYPVDAIAFVEPLDSCNVGPRHWLTMVRIIKENYGNYSGFVILHGTDSMVFTASALSFMITELDKPIVITGSQIAGIVNPRNDAHQNMITAIMLANPEAHKLALIPEVFISFGNLIVRGNRAKKMNVVEYQGFNSPNYPLLGRAGDHIVIERKQIRRPSEIGVQFSELMDTNVIIVEVFPGMQNSPVLSNILQDENLRGVVLKAYGAGNIPTDAPFLKMFTDFIQRGGIVVCTTSCPAGEVVMGLYETSQILVDIGIIGGFDITPEAALCKLMMLLGNFEDLSEAKRLMQQSIAGEQRLSLETTVLAGKKSIQSGGMVELSSSLNSKEDNIERIEKVMLVFKNAKLDPGNDAPDARAAVKLFLDGETTEEGENFLGSFSRRRVPSNALITNSTIGESLVIDLTLKKHHFLKKESKGRIKVEQKVRINVALEGEGGASFSWEDAELKIYTMDQ